MPRSFSFYLPTWNAQVAKMLMDYGHTIVRNPYDRFDALMLCGGPDVSPSLYKEKALPTTFSSPKRELIDIGAIRTAAKDKPKVGICFGGQLLNVLSGGKMWQHVEGHTGPHVVKFLNGDEIECTSTHHQMMIPSSGGVVLGRANKATMVKSYTLTRYYGGDRYNNWEDTEVVWYPGTMSLCFQPHPEYMNMDKTGCTARFMELMDTFVGGTIDKKLEIGLSK